METFRRFTSNILFTLVLTLGTVTAANAQLFTFEKNHTEIRFSWNHLGMSRMSGRFLVYDGQLNLDKSAPEKSTLNVKIDTSGLWTHVEKFNEHLKGTDFFDVAKFPDITFKSTKVERIGDKTAKLTGDLTIKGITKPATFDVALNFDGSHPISKKPTVAFSAKTTVKRTDFDLGKFAPAVSDDVLIEIETEMNPKE